MTTAAITSLPLQPPPRPARHVGIAAQRPGRFRDRLTQSGGRRVSQSLPHVGQRFDMHVLVSDRQFIEITDVIGNIAARELLALPFQHVRQIGERAYYSWILNFEMRASYRDCATPQMPDGMHSSASSSFAIPHGSASVCREALICFPAICLSCIVFLHHRGKSWYACACARHSSIVPNILKHALMG